MSFLMSLSLFGAAIYFVLGFIGNHMSVEHFVASEYLPAAVTAYWNAPPKSRSKLQARIAQDEMQQAAPAINQTNKDQPTRGTTEISNIGSEEVVRTFRAGQRLMAIGDVRLARGLFATSLDVQAPIYRLVRHLVLHLSWKRTLEPARDLFR